MIESVWVFLGDGGRFPSGVFAELSQAEAWISQHSLTGVLTRYPVGEGVYEWAVRTNVFQPKANKVIDGKFVGRFSSAYMDHFHFETGRKAG